VRDEVIQNIGDRIRTLRKENHFSIKKLSEMSGVSPAGIHKIETNRMVPTITVLLKLAKALNKRISYFVEEGEAPREVELIRKRDRKRLHSSRAHVWTENLAGSMEDGLLTGILCTIEPEGNSGREKMSHRGEEMVLVLDNAIEFKIRNKIYPLSKGDCLHFRSEIPHSWRNPSNKQTRTFWVFAPAPFLL